MPLPGEGGPQRGTAAAPGTLHPWTHQCSPTDPEPGGTPAPRPRPPAPTPCSAPQGQISHSSDLHSPRRKLDLPPGSSLGGEKQIRMHHSSQAINTHLYPSLNPSHSAMSAARKIISSSLLQHKHLNSTSIYLWSPHDASRSVREQEMYLRRKIKMCVYASETGGLPRERARIWVCGARLDAYVAV